MEVVQQICFTNKIAIFGLVKMTSEKNNNL